MQPPGLGGLDVAVERSVLAPRREALPAAAIFSLTGRPVPGILAIPRYVAWKATAAFCVVAPANEGTNRETLTTDATAKAVVLQFIDTLLCRPGDQ
jgi:hypothetical protein